jgi:hypothetical protein
MKFNLNNIFKEDTEIFVVNNLCKIEKWFIKRVHLKIKENEDILNKDISNFIYLDCELYNDNVNFCVETFRLSECFFSKKDLINNLNG